MEKIQNIARTNISELVPYSSARELFAGENCIMMDANENPFGKKLNRYPDPMQKDLKRQIAERENINTENINTENIFLGNGSDEIIDLVLRIFCRPAIDNVVTIEPTYGMYEVLARINDVEIRKAPLDENFDMSADKLLSKSDAGTKVVILCSPNNPTGNFLDKEEVRFLLNNFPGIVLLDEAYIDFSNDSGFLEELDDFPNLVVLQTLSKGWGLAGIRLGKAFATKEIIDLLNKVKFPYNVSRVNQEIAKKVISRSRRVRSKINTIVKERGKLEKRLQSFSFIEKIFPSDANFLLIRVKDAPGLMKFMSSSGILLRDRSGQKGCLNCIRVTAGTPRQNQKLLKTFRKYERGLS
mgnify:CR=1 FL=1